MKLFSIVMTSAFVLAGAVWLMGIRDFDFKVEDLVPHGSLCPFGVDPFLRVGISV